MTTSQSPQKISQTSWVAVAVSTLGLWIIPLAVRLWPQGDGVVGGLVFCVFIGIVTALFLCAEFRSSRWIVLVWVPLLAWSAFGVLMTLRTIAAESGGGISAAPLAGVAAVIGLVVAAVLGGATVLAVIFRPQNFFAPFVILAVANTVLVSYATRAGYRQATAQAILLQVLDSKGAPLSGAAVRFTRYGYGPRGTHIYDGEGGPILSGADGIAKIPSRLMRYETQGVISKAGYRNVLFTLGMQYSKWDETRSLTISTEETKNIAWMEVPSTDPVSFSINLPPQSERPTWKHPFQGNEVSANIGSGSTAKHFLDLETGKFGTAPEGDLRFDLFFEMENGQYERPRLRITGVNGAKVIQVPPHFALKEGRPSYENLFRIAPPSGYQNDTVIQRPGDSPGPTVYVAARNGKFFARLTADAWGKSRDTQVTCRVKLFVNPTGSRLLE